MSEKLQFVLEGTPVQNPPTVFKLEVDPEGDLVLYANGTSILYISAHDGVLYRFYGRSKAAPGLRTTSSGLIAVYGVDE